jgi:hypothetical protein
MGIPFKSPAIFNQASVRFYSDWVRPIKPTIASTVMAARVVAQPSFVLLGGASRSPDALSAISSATKGQRLTFLTVTVVSENNSQICLLVYGDRAETFTDYIQTIGMGVFVGNKDCFEGKVSTLQGETLGGSLSSIGSYFVFGDGSLLY